MGFFFFFGSSPKTKRKPLTSERILDPEILSFSVSAAWLSREEGLSEKQILESPVNEM